MTKKIQDNPQVEPKIAVFWSPPEAQKIIEEWHDYHVISPNFIKTPLAGPTLMASGTFTEDPTIGSKTKVGIEESGGAAFVAQSRT